MKTDDSLTIRHINLERIRVYMGEMQTATKSQISRELGLSFPTVTRLVDELCALGELLEQGTGSSTGGRCASCYRMNPMYHLYLLIQVEFSRIRWSLKDLSQNTVEQGEFHFSSLRLEEMDGLCLDIYRRYDSLTSIAVGVAALVSNGIVDETAGFECLRGMDIREHFQALIPIPIMIENDMNFLTAGCWSQRRAQANSLVTLYLGEYGMGGGVIVDGQLWSGASGYTGEAGFLPFLDHYWKELETRPWDMDICELYARLIQIYAVTLNPAMMILYAHPLLEGKLDEIRRRCASYIPAKAMPSIEMSRSYQEDYEKGLFAIARKEG